MPARVALLAVVIALGACSASPPTDASLPTDAADAADAVAPDAGPLRPVARRSSSVALSADGARLYVANADADSVSEIDTVARRLVREIPLGDRAPAPDPATGRYEVAVGPRALALDPRRDVLYVTGQRSGDVRAVDLASGRVVARVAVGSEPVGVVVAPDGAALYVACAQDGTVARVDAARMAVMGEARAPGKPWSLAWSPDGATLYATHLLGPGVTALDPATLAARATWAVPDAHRAGRDARRANGAARALYGVAARPGRGELWVSHDLLATETAQPALNFETTVFPTVTVLGADGAVLARMSAESRGVSPSAGALGDIVSGPRAVEFTPDGRWALVLDTYSEDLLAIDAERRVGARLLRPLPGHMPEGMALSPDGTRLYIEQRNTSDVVVVRVDARPDAIFLEVDGAPVPRLARDPMPASLRTGQRVFHLADSAELPITQNFWVACASCHPEGRSAAVTQRFAAGPRDTPSNAGGAAGTGFLFRTGGRQRVRDYWRTIEVEQGGRFNPETFPERLPLLVALEDYVNRAIPLPVPPRTDPALVARGQALFRRPDVGCLECHAGPNFTDSGEGNPSLDLAGPVELHDVGTCVTTGPHPDRPHQDDGGRSRDACRFDTPSLLGVADSAPYLHDGSAATLRDVLLRPRGAMGHADALAPADLDALVEYLRSL